MSSGPVEPAPGARPAAESAPAHAPTWLNIGPGSVPATAPDAADPHLYDTHPHDPHAVETHSVDPHSGDQGSVDPTWAPPPARVPLWRRWLPGTAVALVCVLAFGTAAVALQEQRPAFDRFLPPEGSAHTVALTDGGTGQLEQTVMVKSQINSHGHLAGVLETSRPADELRRVGWLRASVNPSSSTTAVVIFSVTDGVLALEGFNAAQQAAAFAPGIALARRDGAATAPRQTGRAVPLSGGSVDYTATVAAVPSTDPACPTWVVNVSALPAPMGRLEASLTLCQQRGLQAFSVTSNAGTYGFAQTGPLKSSRFDGSLAGPPSQWKNAARWQPARQILFLDGAFGPEPLSTTPVGNPVLRPGGGLVLVNHIDEDILGLGPPFPGLDAVPLQWRVHPGGSIRTLTTIGELTLAATNQRAVVAYGPDGTRYWTRTFDDVVAGQLAIDMTSETLVAATLDGTITALDARTGTTRWTYDIGSDLALGARVTPTRVSVADSDGGLTQLDLKTGRPVWAKTSDSAAAQLATNDTTVFVLKGTLTALDADSGAVLWTQRVAGNRRNGLVADRSRVVAATQAGVVSFDARTGAPGWTTGGSAILLQVGDVYVVGTGTQVSALRDGKAVGSWDLSQRVSSYGLCECTPTSSGLAFPGPSGIQVLR